MKICSVEGCGRVTKALSYCDPHYQKYTRYGTPLGGRNYPKRGVLAQWILDHLDYSADNCLIWPFGRSDKGYGQVYIDGKIEYAHVVMVTITHGPKPTPKHQVRHLCGNGHLGCVNQRHLVYGTRKENERDKIRHGTHNRGERHGRSKLTEMDIAMIKEMIRSGEKQSEIAEKFGVSQSRVSFIHTGKSWAWPPDSDGAP